MIRKDSRFRIGQLVYMHPRIYQYDGEKRPAHWPTCQKDTDGFWMNNDNPPLILRANVLPALVIDRIDCRDKSLNNDVYVVLVKNRTLLVHKMYLSVERAYDKC